MTCDKKALQYLVFAIFISVSSTAYAQRVGSIRGIGTTGCGEYLQDRKTDRFSQIYAHWVQGFLSGYNIFGSKPQIAEIPDEPTIHAYLEKHCRDNPLNKVAQAVESLIADLGGYRGSK